MRMWRVLGLTAAVLVGVAIAGGAFWLFFHRDFADPTWLDAPNALTVQAAWAQAVFSVAAIIAAIVIGEIQHDRTRRQFRAQEEERRDNARVEKLRAAIVILYALRETRQALTQYVNVLHHAFAGTDRKVTLAETAMILPLLAQGREGWPLLAGHVQAEWRTLDDRLHEDVTRAIYGVAGLHRKAGFIIESIKSRQWTAEAINSWFDGFRDACIAGVGEIDAALRTIDAVHGIGFPEFDAPASPSEVDTAQADKAD